MTSSLSFVRLADPYVPVQFIFIMTTGYQRAGVSYHKMGCLLPAPLYVTPLLILNDRIDYLVN